MRSERRFALIQFAHVIAYHEGDVRAATEAAAYLKTVVRRTTSSARLASACQRSSEASHQQRLQRSSFGEIPATEKKRTDFPRTIKRPFGKLGMSGSLLTAVFLPANRPKKRPTRAPLVAGLPDDVRPVINTTTINADLMNILAPCLPTTFR